MKFKTLLNSKYVRSIIIKVGKWRKNSNSQAGSFDYSGIKYLLVSKGRKRTPQVVLIE